MSRLSLALLTLTTVLAACATPQPATTIAPAVESAPRTVLAATDVAPPSRKAVVRQVLPSNVRLLMRDGKEDVKTASGVVLGSENTTRGARSWVITNAHALDTTGLKQPKLFVLVEDRGEVIEYEGALAAMGSVPDMDLALVEVIGARLPPAELAEDSELEPGEDVVVAAAPYGRAISVTGGMVSQVEWDRKLRRPTMLKTDAAIGYGASGGGVYSLSTGHLLAIVEGYRTAKVGFSVADERYSFDVPMPGETFAAPSSKVRMFLEQKGFTHLIADESTEETKQAAR